MSVPKPITYPIRSQFIPSAGCEFLAMDFSQAESWIVAFSANEPNMKYALQYGDIHRLTATTFFDKPETEISKDERYIGKRCNHALAYRMSAMRLAEVINKDAATTGVSVTVAQAKMFHEKWHDFYHIKSWWGEIERQLSTYRSITTVYGRERTFYARWGDELFKEATAYIPQSTVGDHCLGAVQPEIGIKGGIIGVHEWCKDNCGRVIQTSHDSVMLEVPIGEGMNVAYAIHPLMARPLLVNGEKFTIPVEVEIGNRWGEMPEVILEL